MQATRLIVIRHGETAWNVDTRIQGHLDIPLNDTGRQQARKLGRALAGGPPLDAIYTSDLSRAHETARAVGDATGVPVVTDTGLRERRFGTFEGRTFAEIELELPEQSIRWRKRDPVFAPEGGESLIELRERVVSTAAGLAARHAGGHIALVAHGGVLDILYRTATGQDLLAPRTWILGNAAINRLLWTPEGFTLVGWSDTSHLDDESIDETTT